MLRFFVYFTEKQALEIERQKLETEKKSFAQAVAIKARQIVDRVLRAFGIRTNVGFSIDSQINKAVLNERSEQWKQR